MSKHTPGPWVVEDDCIEAPNSKTGTGYSKMIGSVLGGLSRGTHRVGSKTEQKANARLIAAAPELLDALKELLDISVMEDRNSWRIHDAEEAAHKAVAKATGEAMTA